MVSYQYYIYEFGILVGLSINCVAFTELQNKCNTSPLYVSRSQLISLANTISLLRDKAFTYFGLSLFSKQERPMSGGL